MSIRRSFLDEIDQQILDELQKDARISLQTLARTLQISASTLHYRINRLEEENIIRGYHADINMTGSEPSFMVSILLSIHPNNILKFDDFLKKFHEIEAVYKTTGNFNYHLLTKSANHQDFLSSIYQPLLDSKLIDSIEADIIIKKLK